LDVRGRDVVLGIPFVLPDEDGAGGVDDEGLVEDDADAAGGGEGFVRAGGAEAGEEGGEAVCMVSWRCSDVILLWYCGGDVSGECVR
jgi:hypothetical protein